jgi:ribonuclease P protein component
VLSRAHRMISPRDFTEVTRTGGRAGSTTLVAHVLLPAGERASDAQIGFIVNKSVGAAVMRNRVRRRLRHLCRPLVAELPRGARVVVRALPGAVQADTAQLAADLTSVVRRATARAGRAVDA